MKRPPSSIYIPHIHYTVRVKNFKPHPNIDNAQAYVEHDDKNTCTLYMNLKRKPTPGDLAHELIHVLQFICLDRNINFTLEQEHIGYLMGYLMAQILGYHYV